MAPSGLPIRHTFEEVRMPHDPSQTYVHLDADGSSAQLPGGDAFWSLPPEKLERYGSGWVISEFECSGEWPNWEMHPEGDEFVYLLSGSATLMLEFDDGVRYVPLHGRAATVVPRGVWHTASVSAPSRMLFVTRGAGTRQRPA
jgi:mannose-6-phosphate isomerase-like protein (cupin superfamily)